MRGAWRLTIAIWIAAVLLEPAIASGQDAQPASNAPAPETVGPRELQNFNLQGNVTRPADQPQQPATAAPAAPAEEVQPPPPGPNGGPARRTKQVNDTSAPRAAPLVNSNGQNQPLAPPLPSTRSGANALQLSTPGPVRVPATNVTPEASRGALAPANRPSILPWLLAAAALGVGATLLLWRRRSRPVLAGGSQIDLRTTAEPAPAPAPAPESASPARPTTVQQPRKTPPTPPASSGIVSTGLRAWVEVIVQPLRCVVTDDGVTVEFELELFNSGSAPARDVLVEAVVINAGPAQDKDLAAFFERPPGHGERIDVIRPLARTAFPTQVVVPRELLRPLDAGGRQVFVPLLAFNAFYRRGSNEAQTSVSYLVGRDTKSEKLAPFRVDLGPRVFRGLGARLLPLGIRS